MDFAIYNQPAAYAFVRIFLGILFLMQGYDKVFKIKIRGIINAYELPIQHLLVPNSLVWAGTVYTSFCELICGFLLIIGLFTGYASYFLVLDIIIATIGLGLQNPQLDTKMVFPRVVLLAFLLICPVSWNLFSIDHLI